ncbi:MAG TPA: YtfJ family protein [Syntrophales bacterium]|nr:YtfJ family protein [Syntrophales bacterium]
MRKVLFAVLLVLLWTVSGATAGELKVGDKASDWSFTDGDGKAFTMQNWAGKVLLINYVDPDEKDMNEHFTDAMKKAKDDGLLREADYAGMGIVDCKASWKPDMLIKSLGAAKAKKYNAIVLFDYDATLREAWGLKKDSANAILLDKKGICRAIVRGRVPEDKVSVIVQLAIDLQNE